MLSSLINNRPVGLKASFSLALAVFLTALLVTQLQQFLAGSYLENQAKTHLRQELHTAASMTRLAAQNHLDARQAVLKTAKALESRPPQDNPILFYGLDAEGRILTPIGWPDKLLPKQKYLLQMIRQGKGHLEVQADGRAAWLYFDRVWDKETVLVVQGFTDELVGRALARLQFWTWLAAIVLSLVLFLAAHFYFYFEFTRPLRRITKEGERMASGDLSPPAPIQGRNDEVGRLSRVLSHLGGTAQGMVQEARTNQERFQRIFLDSRDAIIMLNSQGGMYDVNPAAVEMFRFASRQEMLSHPNPADLFLDPDRRKEFRRLLISRGYVEGFNLRLTRADGSWFEAVVTATLKQERGASFVLVRDMTQVRRAERRLKESEKSHRRLLENAPDMIFRWSVKDHNYDYLSPAVKEVLGYTPHEVMDEPGMLRRSIHPSERDSMLSLHRGFLTGKDGDRFEAQFRMRHKDGRSIWVRERSILVHDEQGRPLAVEGVVTDVTDQVEVENVLIKGRQMVESVLQGLPAAVMVIGRDHKIIHWNRAMEKLTGVPAGDRVGTDLQWSPFYKEKRPVLADLIIDNDETAMESLYAKQNLKSSAFVEEGVESEDFYSNLAGVDRTLYFLAAPLKDNLGRITGAVETLVDLSDKRKLEEELTRLSVTDELTGLFNQRFFYATLAREVEAAKRYEHPLTLLLLDLDHFKQYNDAYGHLEGDRVLQECGKLMKSQVRLTDLAARYGGEEFVLLLPHTGRERSLVVAERIRRGIEELEFFPVVQNKGVRKARITASLGVAIYQEGWGGRDLVFWADQAMYEAKHQGRNRVAVHDGEQGAIKVALTGNLPAS